MLWRKPCGKEIETNDSEETVAYCLSLDWEPIPTEPTVKPARKRRKASVANDGNSSTSSES